MDDTLASSLDALEEFLGREASRLTVHSGDDWTSGRIARSIGDRSDFIAACVRETALASQNQLGTIAQVFLRWMQQGTVVRVLGAGRARLAAAIPANRLAHGGARVFVQDDIVPMPHAVRGGGIIAASASGQTATLLETLRTVKRDAPGIEVVGIADAEAHEFRGLCGHFVGIRYEREATNPLTALADTGEYVISEVLDALVVAAGRLGHFDDRRWRLGHENIGATGPYDADRDRIRYLFSEPPDELV
jgi:D-arabinose 5-phosphate isomerase GutQ